MVDEKYRILLGRELSEKAGIGRGGRLFAIPFHGGIILLSLRGKSFSRIAFEKEKVGYEEENIHEYKMSFGKNKCLFLGHSRFLTFLRPYEAGYKTLTNIDAS